VNLEIERKFLVNPIIPFNEAIEHYRIKQGVLMLQEHRSLRIRIDEIVKSSSRYNKPGYKLATLCFKISHSNTTRKEYEYNVDLAEAEDLLSQTKDHNVEKDRYWIPGNYWPGEFWPDGDREMWEVDVFSGLNSGLTIAEIELPSENTKIEIPEWIGKEVTDDPRYLNVNLAKNPYISWKEQ
jgi:adenylate cyclase